MPQVEVDIPRAFLFLVDNKPARYRVVWGGRGGAKSWACARALIGKAYGKRLRILCARELQVSIADSVHCLLAEQIDAMGLGACFEVAQSVIRCHRTGSEFIFKGLRSNINEIKSLEGVDIAWIEEAQSVSAKSWSVLKPTIRKDGSEIWASFNPDLESDPTYQEFVVRPPPNAIVRKVSWRDNPYLPQTLREEMEYLYRIDPEAAAHVWGGETRRNSAAQVLRGRYRVEAFTPGQDWFGPYQGADWGFASDPTTLVRCWVHGRTLYVEHEAWGVGVDLDDTPALFDKVPDARKYMTRADSARPETISHMRRHGYEQMLAVRKGKGSVEDGVEHLRSYESIVIHPRCTHTAEEARLWSYKTDKLSGDVLPELAPGHDHCVDAIRYALEPVIRAGRPTMPEIKIVTNDRWVEREERKSNWKIA